MAETTTADEPTRRDFLFIATGAMGAVAAGFVAWPLIDQMSPDATTLAAASTEVDISQYSGRPDHHGKMARQADLHQPPHAQGGRGGAGRAR